MYNKYAKRMHRIKIKQCKVMTTDSASAYQEFCSNYNIELQAIPS